MKNIYNNGRWAGLLLYAVAKGLSMPRKKHCKNALTVPIKLFWLFRALLLCMILACPAQAQVVQSDVIVNTPILEDTAIEATGSITATSDIEPPARAIFRAGGDIFLQGKFHAKAGSYLTTENNDSTFLFTASRNSSDASVLLEWDIPEGIIDGLPDISELSELPEFPNPSDLSKNGILYLQVLNKATGEEIYFREHYVYNVVKDEGLEGEYRHYVGPGQEIDYQLNIFLEGDGDLVIDPLSATGTTDDYRKQIVSLTRGDFPDRVEISLKNNSDMFLEYRVYRDDTLIGSFPVQGDVLEKDVYSFTSENSLVNGKEHGYVIEPYSDRFKMTYEITDTMGSTFAIGTEATDASFTDQVTITWNDVSAFADAIEITRDGDDFVQLPATSTSFTDIRPVFGENHEYGVILIKEGNRIVAAYDKGGVNPNGLISGRITSQKGDIATAGAMVVAKAQVGTSINDTTYTDATGFYQFTGLRYGEIADYTIKVTLEGHTFSPDSLFVPLERSSHTALNVDFKDEYDYEEGAPTFNFSDLTVVANEPEDYMQLDWDYTQPTPINSVYFKIFRKEDATDFTLVDLLTDNGSGLLKQYKDFSGLPGTEYTYKVEAYAQQEDTVSQTSLDGTAVYPQSPVNPGNITAVPNATLGTIDLQWSHASKNFAGFKLYRDSDEVPIAVISKGQVRDDGLWHYRDKQGRPGSGHIYEISPYIVKDGQEYDADSTVTAEVGYPLLPPVTNLVITPGNDRLQLTWAYPTVATEYNYDGVNIYRDDVLIGTVLKEFPAAFADIIGVPGTSHAYRIHAFKYNKETDDQSSPLSTTADYPTVTAPHNLLASDNAHIGYVDLQWQHTSDNYDGIVIYRGDDSLTTVPVGTIAHKDVVPGAAVSIDYNYSIKAFRKVDGVKYYSTEAMDIGSALPDGSPDLQAPVNFMASDDLAGHVLLEWEYPEYVLSQFEIYRDGDLLTTLFTDNRVYYDYEAIPGKIHVYQVRSIYEGKASYREGDLGSLGTVNTISGTVAVKESGRGIQGVTIQAIASIDGNDDVRTVTTDAAGYYRIEGVPDRPGIPITISAALQNHNFERAQQMVNIREEVAAYTVNFKSLFADIAPESDTVAVPVDVVAIPNPASQAVEVRWNASSTNYSGFKVYRGLVEIADISAQHNRSVIDSKGFPGYDYAYRVQAYWDTPYGKKESDLVADLVTYPVIPPIEHLKVVQLEQEDVLQLTWSHPTDKHDYYFIDRNDERIDTVATRNRLEYADSTGIPGHTYKYSVTAVKNTQHGLFSSIPIGTAGAIYPDLSQVFNLQMTIPDGQHHIQVSWDHLSNNVDGYFVYRNNTLIDTLYQDTTGYKSMIDRQGVPGEVYTYRVSTFAKRKGMLYESVPFNSDEITYPAIRLLTGVSASPNVPLGIVNLSWNYDLNEPEDVTGYKVYRNGELIKVVTGKENTSFTDNTGTPEADYMYEVRVFDIRDKVSYESEGVAVNSIYPKVPVPFNVVATNDLKNQIKITWDYNAVNNDGFVILRKSGNSTVEVDRVPAGKRSFAHIINEKVEKDSTFDYYVQTYKDRPCPTCPDYLSELSNPAEGTIKANTPPTDLTNLEVSAGTYLNRVSVGWQYTGADTDADVKVYRDGVHLATVPARNNIFNDNDGVPGKKYVYRVVLGDSSIAALGHKKANGLIKGSVITQGETSVGVPGVSIHAFAMIEGEKYTYDNIITDAAGEYEIPEVYYGERANYTVSASYKDHSFVKDAQEVGLEQSITTGNVPPFVDKSASIISGTVHRALVVCGIDSVKLILKTIKDGQELKDSTYTDTKGFYSFPISPQDQQVTQYQLMVATEKTYTEEGQRYSTYFEFENGEVAFLRDSINQFSLVTRVDFKEITTYPVTLKVQSTCGPIGNNRFDVRVSSTDGCFTKTYRTSVDTVGMTTVPLPPLNYEMMVTGIEKATPDNLAVVDYLRVRPVALPLDTLHRMGEREGTGIDSDLLVNTFTYHKAPQIEIAGFTRYLCNESGEPDPEMPAIVKQGDPYTLNLNVFEAHEELCPVNEGFLIVKNAAADDTAPVRLDYDPEQGGFSAYTFTAGDPITIAPYTLGLVVEYHTESGGYQGEKIQPIIVTGEKSPPGNDIIVSMDKSTIQMPLFILRDPPGDQSYSYIEEGKTFEKTLTVSDMNSGGAGPKIEVLGSLLGIGAFMEFSLEGGGGDGRSASFNVSVTTNQRIETASDSKLENNYISGEQADIIVGVGLSTAYGITEKIEVNEDCEIIKSTAIQLNKVGFDTEWHYSVFQIEKLIEEYARQLRGLKAGTFEIKGKDQDEAKGYLTTLKGNWEKVLNYHRKETVPMCQICNLEMLPPAFKETVEGLARYQDFCSEVKEKCDSYMIKGLVWTDDLMKKYNLLNEFRNELDDYISYTYTYPIHNGTIDGLEAVVITSNILENVDLNGEYQQLYGPEVKNITYDGAAGPISNEITVAKSQSRGLVQKTYVDAEAYTGAIFDVKLVISKGLGVVVENAPEISSENRVGLIGSYHFEFEKTKENTDETTATVGYVLDDDDDGDQFSVTVVKGIDPSHTPYFSLVGGRSSCPYDEGTISRYDPQLFVVLPDGSLTKEAELWDVDPEGPASFQVKMASGNLFDENLLYYLYAPTELFPNQNDAEIFLQIGGENDGTGTRYIKPGSPQHTQVDIFRREGDVYDYEDIVLALSPKCEENYNTVADYITLKAHFKRPCSPVSLVSDGNRTITRGGTTDGNRWVLNKAPEGEREQLFLKIVDYDPESQVLEDIHLEYRRAGANHWINIVTLDKETLAAYYEDNRLTYPNPTYPYIWDITGLDLVDGEYEVRAMTACGTSGENFSNILTGIIDRTSLQVFGKPEPINGVLSPEDQIMVTFNGAIDCARFDPATITLANISGGDTVPVEASVTCNDNQLAIVADHVTLAMLDGDTLQVEVASALDVYGNELEDTVRWQFAVHYEPVYWLPNTLEVDVFKGETAALITQLFNTSGSSQEFLLSGHEGLSWLTVSKTGGAILPSGLDISLIIDTKTLDVGSYTQNLTAAITGYQDEELSLTVNVLPERPDWQVDLGEYPDNATVIANFNLDGEGLSTDTLDLVSVWIGNSLRGVANITKVSDTDYVAYITVAGSTTDEGEALSFRVWDASTGTEYDAFTESIYPPYSNGYRYGTTVEPVILTVDSNRDIPRYIPLRAGWNWLSVNTSQTDMSVSKVLKSLTPTEGDQLKTLNSTSNYSASLGWESLDGLDSINTSQGYLLYLAKADTLRLTGTDATLQSVILLDGWNLIGYPLQEASAVNEALTISNLTDGDVLKGDKSLAEYNALLWSGMRQLQPYQSYMIHMDRAGLLSYHAPGDLGTVINRDKAEFGVSPGTANDGTATGEAVLSMARSVNEWSVNPTDFEYNMTFTGAIVLEEGQEVYPGSKVVAFVGEECRGIGTLVYIEALDRYETSLFVYANAEGEEVTFKIVDEEIAKVYGTVNKEPFVANTHYGSFTEPYFFQGREVLSSSSMLMAYPNPFEKEVTVKFTTEQAGNYQWVLRDEIGALMLSGEVDTVRGVNTLTLDLGRELPAGVYLFSLTGTVTYETIKLMKYD